MKPQFKRRFYRSVPWVCLLSIFWFGGCLEEIALNAPIVNPESIAIRGVLKAGDTVKVIVRITNVSNFRAFEIPEPIRNARVFVEDELGDKLEVPMEESGDYQLIMPEGHSDFRIEPGKFYKLSVELPDGRHYRSTVEPLHPVPEPTSLTFGKFKREFGNEIGNIVVKEYLDFRVNTPIIQPDGQEKSYLKWSAKGVFRFSEPPNFNGNPLPSPKICFSYEDLNLETVIIFNGAESRLDTLYNFHLLEKLMDYRFHEGYYLTVYQQSLSAGAYHYWEQVKDLINLDGTVYDPPPGEIKGNIRNVNDETEDVFGYFYATQETLIRKYIPRGLTNSARFCPDRITIENYMDTQRQCFNCLLRPGSTYEKPDFWEF